VKITKINPGSPKKYKGKKLYIIAVFRHEITIDAHETQRNI
jgi:hypothetical protein